MNIENEQTKRISSLEAEIADLKADLIKLYAEIGWLKAQVVNA